LFERHLGPAASLEDLSVEEVRAYISELQDRDVLYANNPRAKRPGKLSSAYIQGVARTLRAFASWLHLDGYTKVNVLKILKPPRIQQKVVEVLTDDEVARLVAVIARDDAFGARDFALIWMMLDSGLRAAEVCGLHVEDAHFAQGYLKVLGKGNKERLVPIGRNTQDALLRWRDRFRPRFEYVESPFLFLSSGGRPLTVASLEEIVRRLGERANVKRVHCHLLRHTFATNYLVRQVGDPLRLQQILGHTSLEMVRRYVSISTVQRNLIEARTSPMDLLAIEPEISPYNRRVQPRRTSSTKPMKSSGFNDASLETRRPTLPRGGVRGSRRQF
jgi:site-specific recombinase XerD